jgi:hypothetical protein
MLLFLKRLVLVVTSALLLQTTHAFSLLGPFDTWQTSVLGYDPQNDGGDLAGPKNLGEEWRWTLPKITYAFDDSFLEYFGTNGVQAVEDAIFLFNKEMTNLSGLTDAHLRAKPLEAKRVHETAQALGLLDLKSYTMGLLAEQLGMASSERWTWALRASAAFPTFTNYLVIKRNFDPFTLKPSSYVNGRRLSYFIGVFPATTTTFYEDAVEIAIDQAGDGPFFGSTVSSQVGEDLTGVFLGRGEYFSSLTQDDIGGLRYMYKYNNWNPESLPLSTNITRDVAVPAIQTIDRTQLTFIPGVDAFTLFSLIRTSNPSLLLSNIAAIFPGLETNLTLLSTNFTLTRVVSNFFVLTNLTSSGLFTNISEPALITNLDLYTFSEASRTNSPNQLQALYPTLVISATNSGFATEVREQYFLTNSPYGSPTDPLIIATNRITNLFVNYFNQYANVVTNYASAVTDLEFHDIHPATYATPTDFVFETNITRFRTNKVSGGFYILNRATNASLINYTFYDQDSVPLKRVTNIIDIVTNVFTFTNLFNALDVRQRDVVNHFTNVVYGAYPVEFNTGIGSQIVQIFTTNFVPVFTYTFDTNNLMIFPPVNGNTNVTLQTITFLNGVFQFVNQSNVFPEIPRGSVLILDTNRFVLALGTNQFGQLEPIRTEISGLVTNIISTATNALTGEYIVQQVIYQTNFTQFAVYPVTFSSPTAAILRPGVDTLQFVRQPYIDYLSQSNFVSTNYYQVLSITNGIQSTNIVRRITGADIVFAAADIGVSTGAFPPAASRDMVWQRTDFLGNIQTLFSTLTGRATSDGGPGQIVGGTTITFSKLNPSFLNQNPGLLNEEDGFLALSWGSFDSKTLVPRVYPEDLTGQLQTLADLVLRKNTNTVQVLP